MKTHPAGAVQARRLRASCSTSPLCRPMPSAAIAKLRFSASVFGLPRTVERASQTRCLARSRCQPVTPRSHIEPHQLSAGFQQKDRGGRDGAVETAQQHAAAIGSKHLGFCTHQPETYALLQYKTSSFKDSAALKETFLVQSAATNLVTEWPCFDMLNAASTKYCRTRSFRISTQAP